MKNNHAGKTYIIIGASGGIGFATAQMLSDLDANLFMVSRSAKTIEKKALELCASYSVADASTFMDLEGVCQRAINQYKKIDGIVNCAGSLLLKSALNTSESELADVLDSNLITAFSAVRAASKYMANTGGSVVLISSASARVGLANHEAIATAKAGVIGLTLSAAATNAPYNIRINAVAPGLVETPMTEQLVKNDAARKVSESIHVLGRLGKPEDVASMIVWLLDPANSWVTGQVFGVDGGMATVRSKVKA